MLYTRKGDGGTTKNKLENLVWLCHNCHHEIHYGTVETYKFSLGS